MNWRKPLRDSSSSIARGILWFALLTPAAASADDAQADKVTHFDIPRQRADQALIQFAEQADITFIFPADDTRKVTANEVRGEFTHEEAVQKLLAGTGLKPKFQANGELIVNTQKGDAVKKRGLIASIIAALAGGSALNANAQNVDTAPTVIEEIIVTAQKREERLLDVPVPVTAISATRLTETNQTRLEDYFASVPGLNLSPDFRGGSRIAIRGLTADLATNPTVGVSIDDSPYGSSTQVGGGYTVPDIDPSDLARIEVLRGPQGTLYGANSIGGLIKFVTVDPSTEKLTGRLQEGLSTIHGGDDTGYNVRGAVNIPFSDTAAVRASGFTRRDPGYIDNVRTGEEDVNRGTFGGGHISALWRPSENFSVKLGALIQTGTVHGLTGSDLRFGELEQSALKGSGKFDSESQAYSANINARFAGFELVSISGYGKNRHDADTDFSAVIPDTFLQDLKDTDRFSQEIRLSSSLGDRIDWTLGGFYTHEKSDSAQNVLVVDPATGKPTGAFVVKVPFPSKYEESAAFGNLTLKVTERFHVQFGAREADISQALSQTTITPTATIFQPEEQIDSNAFTYLVTPRFKISPDLMVYSRLASGYRPGGNNINIIQLGLPAAYGPDKTQNYEIGSKGSLLGGRLTFDFSVYYINWKDIQILVREQNRNFFANVGTAKSQGVELSVGLRPSDDLTLNAWVAWNDAQLTETIPSTRVFGEAGDRLPYSSRFSGNLSLDQSFRLTDSMEGFWGGAVSYVGERLDNFTASASIPRLVLPAYTRVDLRIGAKFGHSWTASLYANNVLDKRGVFATSAPPLSTIRYIDPRTIGLSLTKDFF